MQMNGSGIICTGYLYINPPVQTVTVDFPYVYGGNPSANVTSNVGYLLNLRVRYTHGGTPNCTVTLSGTYIRVKSTTSFGVTENPSINVSAPANYRDYDTGYVRYA